MSENLTYLIDSNTNLKSKRTTLKLRLTYNGNLVLGVGYRLNLKTFDTVRHDMIEIGLREENAIVLAKARNLSGRDAKVFIETKGIFFQLTPKQEINLFQREYSRSEREFMAYISDIERKFPFINVTKGPQWVRDVFIDFWYTGTFNITIAEHLFTGLKFALQNNNYDFFENILRDYSTWEKMGISTERMKAISCYTRTSRKIYDIKQHHPEDSHQQAENYEYLFHQNPKAFIIDGVFFDQVMDNFFLLLKKKMIMKITESLPESNIIFDDFILCLKVLYSDDIQTKSIGVAQVVDLDNPKNDLNSLQKIAYPDSIDGVSLFSISESYPIVCEAVDILYKIANGQFKIVDSTARLNTKELEVPRELVYLGLSNMPQQNEDDMEKDHDQHVSYLGKWLLRNILFENKRLNVNYPLTRSPSPRNFTPDFELTSKTTKNALKAKLQNEKSYEHNINSKKMKFKPPSLTGLDILNKYDNETLKPSPLNYDPNDFQSTIKSNKFKDLSQLSNTRKAQNQRHHRSTSDNFFPRSKQPSRNGSPVQDPHVQNFVRKVSLLMKRFWMIAGEVNVLESTMPEFGELFLVNDLKFKLDVRVQRTLESNCQYGDAIEDKNDHAVVLAHKISEILNKLSKYYPCFLRVQQLGKAWALAKWLHKKKYPIDKHSLQMFEKQQQINIVRDQISQKKQVDFDQIRPQTNHIDKSKSNLFTTGYPLIKVNENLHSVDLEKDKLDYKPEKMSFKLMGILFNFEEGAFDNKIFMIGEQSSLNNKKNLGLARKIYFERQIINYSKENKNKMTSILEDKYTIKFPLFPQVRCATCERKLKFSELFHPQNNIFFCRIHHPRSCGYCFQIIDKDFTKINGIYFHKECVTCNYCGKLIRKDSTITTKNYIVHVECNESYIMNAFQREIDDKGMNGSILPMK